jgi:hypothetical protein
MVEELEQPIMPVLSILVVAFQERRSLIRGVLRVGPMDDTLTPTDVPAQPERRRLKTPTVVQHAICPARSIEIEDVLVKPPIPI